MKYGIKIGLLGILCVEVMWFGYHSLCGKHGYIYLYKTHKKAQILTIEIAQLEIELDKLKNEIKFCKLSLFHHEHYARTRLHMAREDEEIYLT